MSKVRVHELAKQLGMSSKEVLAKLQELGEFVRSASSTVEAPVVRKLTEMFPNAKPIEAKQPVKKTALKKVAAEPMSEVSVEQVAKSAPVAIPTAPAAALPKPAPRPGNNPFSTPGALPRPQRPPGNNPFSTSGGGGTHRPPQRPTGASASGPRGGMSGPRPGSVRPGFAARPSGPRPPSIGGNFPPRTGAPSIGPYKSSGPSTAGAPSARPTGARPPQRGGAGGAFGKNASKSSKRKPKSRKALRDEFDNMQAPQLGGAVIPHGDGKTSIRMRRGASLADFADKIGADSAALVSALFHLGEMVTATQSVDAETFEILGAQLGYVINLVSPEDEDRELLQGFDIDLIEELANLDPGSLVARPPVVTVMGHVDHGKTSLLDAIRKSEVMKSEAGGITQHIGAYQIHHSHGGNNRAITFIDTPGHEAFTAMRARGAKVTDIAVLVIAADDGIMPQTIEALNHAQAADVPIVVAVNKIDKIGANPEKVRQQLTEYNLIAEEYGGETIFVNVSAKTGVGIDALIESILLTADAAIDLRAIANDAARGVAIEAHLDRGRGPVATVLVQRGTLKIGDAIVAGSAFGRVRAMLDEDGQSVDEAGPSRPVQVLGFTSVPNAGDTFLVADDDRTARQIAEKRQAAVRNAQLAKARKKVSLEDFMEQSKITTLNLILKGDVSGSVEALEDALVQLDVGAEVDLRVIHRGVGAITKSDITLASASTAVVIGFNVKPEPQTAIFADQEGVEVRFYSVIYKAIEEIELSLKGLLKPEFEEVVLGNAEVREIFKSSKVGNIAGSIVKDGIIRRNAQARILRDGVIVLDNLTIDSLKRFKDDANEVREGFECGIGVGSAKELQAGDIVQVFEMREKKRA